MKLNKRYIKNQYLIIRVSIILTLIFLIVNNLYPQYQQEWLKKFKGTTSNGTNFGNCIAFDKLNNIYVAGCVTNNQAYSDYVLIKYNSSGNQIWQKSYNGQSSSDDLLSSLFVDDLGNAYVTGSSHKSGSDDDCVTIKYDSSGNLKWINVYDYGVNRNDYGKAIRVDKNRNVYVFGQSSITSEENDLILIKYDTTGIKKWVRRYSGFNINNVPSDLELDNSGNIYVTGSSMSGETGWDFVTIIYSTSGDSLWTRRYDFNGLPNCATSLAVDSTGNLLVLGYSYNYSQTNTTLILIKYDLAGTLLWNKTFQNNNSVYNDYGIDLNIDRGNFIYVVGYTCNGLDLGTNRDYLTIRYKPNGDTSWVRKYNGPGNNLDCACSLTIDRFCNVYVTGESYGYGSNSDYFTISYDTIGNTIWSSRYNGSANGGDEAQFIALDYEQNIIVTGSAFETGSYNNIVTIKFSNNVGIRNTYEIVPAKYLLYQNFPNPFNPTTMIKYGLPKKNLVSLSVYDISGREVAKLVNEVKPAGYHTVFFNASSFASGVYFYQIIAEDFIQTHKMVLIK
ncbi:MAG: T9SS type A sorting domain-containing protein [Bacteroidetes bacterium]|nr:T9SS type A sorting domain-containing protein [Bacteroidota bacterium]